MAYEGQLPVRRCQFGRVINSVDVCRCGTSVSLGSDRAVPRKVLLQTFFEHGGTCFRLVPAHIAD